MEIIMIIVCGVIVGGGIGLLASKFIPKKKETSVKDEQPSVDEFTESEEAELVGVCKECLTSLALIGFDADAVKTHTRLVELCSTREQYVEEIDVLQKSYKALFDKKIKPLQEKAERLSDDGRLKESEKVAVLQLLENKTPTSLNAVKGLLDTASKRRVKKAATA